MTTETREFPLRHVLAVYTRLKLLEWGEPEVQWAHLVEWIVGPNRFMHPEVFRVAREQLLRQFPWLKSLDGYQGEVRNGEPMISASTWALVDTLETRHGRVVPVMRAPEEDLPQPIEQTVTYMGEVQIELDPTKKEDLPTQFLRQIRDAIANQIRREKEESGESEGENPW